MVCGLWSSHGAAPPEDWQAYRSARERAREVEQADPRAAVDAWYAVFKERPKLDAWVGVLACSELVRLHYERVKDPKTALELCDWALKQYAGSPALARTAADKASVLLREGRPDEAEAAVAAHWDLVTRSYYAYTDAAVRQRFLALERQGKAAEGEELLARALKEIPQLLDEAQQNPKGWIYNRLVHSLSARQRADEALSWAKARFVTCRYDPAAMERSGRALVSAWSAKDPSRKDARAFLAALSTPHSALSTPHSALPPVDRRSAEEILTRVQGGAQPTHDRISLHLLVGNVREAFLEARRLLVDNPEQPAGTLELCRVLKALELSPARANALVAFLKEGAGADPLPEALRPLGITPEALPAEVRAGQRTALANTALVPGDALAEKLGQGAPLPETVAAAGLPASLPVPVPTDPAALPQAAPAPTAAGAAAAPPAAIPMPMPAKVEVALPALAAPPATAPVKTGATGVAGIEGVGPAPVAAAPVPVVAGIGGVRPATGMVATPAPATPAPVVPAGGPETAAAAAPTVAATPGIAMPMPVSENAAAATIALTRLQAGEITPEAAWEEGKLTAADIIRTLEALPIWGQDAYANALTGLLVAHFPERVQGTETLSARLRVCLARYYGGIKDARCVALWERLLRDPATDVYVEVASAALGAYYQAIGDIHGAAQARLDGERRSRSPAVRANSLLGAARLFSRMGDDSRATQLYDQVARYGYGWATGMALYDQAVRLVSQGKHEDARRLLQRPVEGRYSDQVRVGMLWLLGMSYYRTGDLASARTAYANAIDRYRSLASPLAGEGLEEILQQAREGLHWIDVWEKQPLLCSPKALSMPLVVPLGRHVNRMVTVRCFRPVMLEVRVGSAKVSNVVTSEWRTGEHANYYEQDIVLSIPPQALAKAQGPSFIALRSGDLPGVEVRIPVVREIGEP